MKNQIIIVVSIISLALFTRCTGDHTARSGSDTAVHQTNVPSNVDTAQITTTTGDASNIDNSGSGGTKIDTGKHGVKKDTVKK